MADAGIACWDGKYRYVFWRTITAIRTGSGAVGPDPAWEPLLDVFPSGTPAYPEYPSGHSTVNGAAAFTLADAFGEDTAFSTTSDVRPGTRSFTSFSAATSEIANARVFGGIHYRTSCVRGNMLGRTVADYISKNAYRNHNDKDED
jgi:membrane-associated phospholipid phosphatase